MFGQQLRKAGNPCNTGLKSRFAVVLGAQWGDEGKGKLVDILAKDYDVTARFNGGANAGHTIVVNGKYLATGDKAGSYENWFAIVSELAAREHSDAAAAPAKP